MGEPRERSEREVGRPFRLLRSAPAPTRCGRCGVGGTPLAAVRFDGGRLHAERTLCEYCTGVLFEGFIETDEGFVELDELEEVLALRT
jgi:hypothetical protein